MLLTEKQTEYVRRAKRRWNLKGGATRSGKTYLDYRWVIPMRIRERIGHDGLVVIMGVTQSTIERNVLTPMREIYGGELVGRVSNDNTVKLFGERAYVLGAERADQVSKIQGASVKYAYGDEVTNWAREVWEMLKSRLDRPDSCFDGTYNPANPEHWLAQFLATDADIYSQTYTIDDNPFLPAEFVRALKEEYAGTVYYNRYILGEWCRAEGLIYPYWGADCQTNQVIPPRAPGWEYYASMDYGTLNPCAMLLWAVNDLRQQAIAIGEYYHSGRDGRGGQLTDGEYYAALTDLIGDYDVRAVVIDPSAASMTAEIRHHGRWTVRKAQNDVTEGIRRTGTLLRAGKILINPTRCPNTCKEFRLYSWDERSGVDRPIKEHDHAMDAIRYMAYTVLRPRGW